MVYCRALILLCCIIVESVSSKVQWNILSYIQGNNNLAEYASYNINEMKKIGSTNKINLMVQLDEPRHKKIWRYHILKQKMVENGSFNGEMGRDPEQELVDAASWAHTFCPSNHMMIILWNHGNGILDEPKIHDYRGILYNYSNNTFMNNQQLDNALARITTTVLGKKLDILGMDACLMGMIEVAYQVKEYAHLLIASENVERAPGWYYAHSLEALNKIQGTISARTIALHITSSFALFNRHRTSAYTLSTIDLSRMIALKNSINDLVFALKACHKKKPVETKILIAFARDYALEIEEGNYIDFLSFLNLLKSSLELSQKSKHGLFVALKAVLEDCVHFLKETVIISRIGLSFAGTGGLSIYFPRQSIHHSYVKTKFAQDTDWLSCIKLYQQHRRRRVQH